MIFFIAEDFQTDGEKILTTQGYADLANKKLQEKKEEQNRQVEEQLKNIQLMLQDEGFQRIHYD